MPSARTLTSDRPSASSIGAVHTDPTSVHVVVVQGDALQIACDEVLAPTHENGTVCQRGVSLIIQVLPHGWKAASAGVLTQQSGTVIESVGSTPVASSRSRTTAELRECSRAAVSVSAESADASASSVLGLGGGSCWQMDRHSVRRGWSLKC